MRMVRDILAIRRAIRSGQSKPMSVVVNITGRCNLACEFCEKRLDAQPQELSLQQVQLLIDLAVEQDCPIFLSGGEPFLHHDIWGILDYACQQNKRVSIVSNGLLLRDLTDEQVELLNETVAMMSLSLDSADPAEHDRIRGVAGCYDVIVDYLRDSRRSHAVGLASVLYPDAHNAAGLIDLAGELGVSINFQPMMYVSNFPHLMSLESKDAAREAFSQQAVDEAVIRQLNRQARRQGVTTNLRLIQRYWQAYQDGARSGKLFQEELLREFLCVIPLLQITVDEFGWLLPCALVAGETPLSDCQTPAEILEHWKRQGAEFREKWRNGWRNSACKSCSCHFAENFRSNILAFPVSNWGHLPWMMLYYLSRWRRGAGRKV